MSDVAADHRRASQGALKIYAPLGLLGYGFPEPSLHAAMEWGPDLIAVDAGSTDPGPYYLGAGVSFTSRTMVKRDLGLLLGACVLLTIGAGPVMRYAQSTAAALHDPAQYVEAVMGARPIPGPAGDKTSAKAALDP